MLKILVVDDSRERIELIQKTLMSQIASKFIQLTVVTTADGGRELLSEPFDLLILDILLPKKQGSTPQALHSINLLSDINNPKKPYIRPGLIIGLTADISELSVYKSAFLEHASVVLDGSTSNQDWLDALLAQVNVLIAVQQKKQQTHAEKILISAHGIRTYGKWQDQLSLEISKYSKSFEFFEVKYGFFDILSFAIPFLRNRKIRMISNRVKNILDNNKGKEIFIVAHSFGTLIISEALKSASRDSIEAVFLCGSPLSHNQDIDHVVAASKVTTNECGTTDFILILARVLLLGLGDAGRVGFARETSSRFINRYFKGGHSLYFQDLKDEKRFYEKYWLPTMITGCKVEHYDSRSNFFGEDIVDLAIKFLTIVKPLTLLCLLLTPFLFFV
ncbi:MULTISPECIES: hypothetical protein [unclassified Pseudomonas]|uniref:hypothetical protein n=1 Tax=unclassified Pseudomonas TaxID=196821 RepID=UPI0011B82082|nr:MULTISPECIES: hypothetical protein [unclassified Pseudomonas]MDW3713383.1 hypothetical protein [Pseudomonas sp. 2023EL-01195]